MNSDTIKPGTKPGYRFPGSGGALTELYADQHPPVPSGSLTTAFTQSGHSPANQKSAASGQKRTLTSGKIGAVLAAQYVHPRIDADPQDRIIRITTKANLTKVRDAKPRVLASSE